MKRGIILDNNLKNEFKELIRSLSTEICKEVLLEELKKLNDSFILTSENYKELEQKYAKNIDGIKEQLTQLQQTNEMLNEFNSSTIDNNNKVNKALNIIEGGHKEVIENIIADNRKIFKEYSTTIQDLNKNERKKFISELILSMNNHSQKYLSEVKNIVNKNDLEVAFKNLNIVTSKIDSLETRASNMEADLHNVEQKIKNELSLLEEYLNNQMVSKVDQHSNAIDNKISKLYMSMEELDEDMKTINKTIRILIYTIIIIGVIILLK